MAEIYGGFSDDPVLPGTPKSEKKVLLWGKRGGTLLLIKSMPFLFVATISSLLYLLCLKLGSMDFFQSLLFKIGCSLGSRVLLKRGLGWLMIIDRYLLLGELVLGAGHENLPAFGKGMCQRR